MDMTFNIDPDDFQVRKKARIEELRKPQGELWHDLMLVSAHHLALPLPNAAPLVSAPTNHEIAGFMPGRLEFEHEVENEAEMAVKDMEFGLVWKYGGDEQPQAVVTVAAPEEATEEEGEDQAGQKGESSKSRDITSGDQKGKDVQAKEEKVEQPEASGSRSGSPRSQGSPKEDGEAKSNGKGKAKEVVEDVEDEDELDVKLAMLEIYFSKLDKRDEAKEVLFDRCLTDYKKVGPCAGCC
jgi:transcriptional adapter 2-alpha